jgi:hypothetical protein
VPQTPTRRSPRSRKVKALTFKVGTVLLVATGMGVSADAYTASSPTFWTNSLMLTSISLVLTSLACFIKVFWATSLNPRRIPTFPDVTVELTSVHTHTGPSGTFFQEFYFIFTNNRPLLSVSLIARYRAKLKSDDPNGLLETPHFECHPTHLNSRSVTPMPLAIPAGQSKPACIVFGMPHWWASRLTVPIEPRIEFEDRNSGRRVCISCPHERLDPLRLDELPLVESETRAGTCERPSKYAFFVHRSLR